MDARTKTTTSLASLVAELRRNPVAGALFADRSHFLAVLDTDGVVVDVNEWATAGRAYGPDAYLGVPFWDTPGQGGQPAERAWRTRMASAREQGAPVAFDDTYTGKDGRTLSVHAELRAIEDGGEVVGFLLEATDVELARETERRLREQERLRRLIFEQSYQVNCVMEPDGTVVDINRSIDRYRGDRTALIGRSMLDIAAGMPDAHAQVPLWHERLAAIADATGPLHYSDVRRDPEGRFLVSVESTLTPVRDDEGRLELILYEVHDTTDTYRARERLERSEARFRSLAEAIPQMLWIAKPPNGVEYFSPRWAEFTGRPIDELLGMGFFDLVHPDDRDGVRTMIPDAEGSAEPVTFRMRRADGQYRWVEAQARAELGPDGTPVRWFGATLDVEERRQAEEDKRTQRQQLEVALSLSGLATYATYLREERIVPDERFNEIVGFDAGAVSVEQGMAGLFETIHPEDRERVAEAMAAAMVPGGPDYDVEYRILRPGDDGLEERWTAALGRIEFDEHGPYRMIGVIEDTTDRRQEDEARLRVQKMQAIGTLAGGIAHDFNNVIGAILSYARVAELEVRAGESPETSIGEIARGAVRAGELVKRLLTFAREEEPQRIPFDLGDIADEACSLVRPTLPRGVSVAAAVAPGVPQMLGDPGQLHQVVVNLVTNAGQALAGAGATEGRIALSVESLVLGERRTGTVAALAPGEYVRLRVRDDGPGIPQSVIGRIFDPFFTTKGPSEGTGLGLAAVASIIRNHGGAIAAESPPVGGAVFTAYLPVVAAPDEAHPAPAPAPVASDAGPVARVLFVDDEEALVRLAYRAMPYCGCEVTGFTEPAEALEAFRADPGAFDAVVTDLSMPGMTGLELTEQIRTVRADVPVVLTSGYMASDDHAEAERRGVDAVMPKPCSIDDLAGEVHRLLGR